MSEFGLGPGSQTSYAKPILLALAVLVVIAAVFYYFNPRKGGDLSVLKTQLYDPHTVFTEQSGGVHVLGTTPQAEDDLYLVVTARVTDKLRFPFRINDITATYTAPDGSTLETYAAGAADLPRLQQIFPALAPMMGQPLNENTQLPPGEPVEGTVVLHFPNITEAAWKARKSATLTVNLIQQPPLTAPIP